MAKIKLTDRYIKSRKPAPSGARTEFADAIVPGLALRVTEKGHKSFVLVARYPMKPKNPTRRAIGDYGAITLDGARDKARGWLELIGRGIDPKVQEARDRAAERRKQVNTFGAVATAFLDRHVKGPAYAELERLAGERRVSEPTLTEEEAFAAVIADPKNARLVAKSREQGIAKKAQAERIIESEFVKRWGDRPAGDIQPEEVAEAVRAIVKRGAPYQAHNAFGYLRLLYSWAIGTGEFGLDTSPVERLSPSKLIGKREARERTLTEEELRAVWAASEAMGYPYGPLFKLLILTGQREREVADVDFREIDFDKQLWTIPAHRMKGGRAHEVPLTPDAIKILKDLPQFTEGHFAFTTTAGEKPVNGFSKAKARIDKLSKVADWKIHDLRRTMRTHLSALPVEDMVRELVIAHAKPGLHKVYDQHAYQSEKRRCLELWQDRLNGIIKPKEADVTSLDEERAKRSGARA